MAGFTAAWWWPAPAFGLWPLAVAAALLALTAGWSALRNHGGRWWGLTLVLSVLLTGFVFLQVRQPYLHETDTRPPREVTLTIRVHRIYPVEPADRSLTGLGTITAAESDPELTGREMYFSAIRRISVSPRPTGRYRIRGVIEALTPEGSGFDDYLRHQGIRHKLTRARLINEVAPPSRFRLFCHTARTRLEYILKRGLEQQPETASIYTAMLLGGKAALPEDQQEAFRHSGTFHVFSISGLHVGVIAAALYAVLNLLRLPRRLTAGLSLLILWFYVQITGAGAPAIRAYTMIFFFLVARVFRLPGNALAALTASALLVLLVKPLQLFNPGFQMSYTVVTALMVMGIPLGEKWLLRWRPFALLPRSGWRWHHHRIAAGGRKVLAMTAGGGVAFLASTPAGIGYFHVFSPGSLLANLIILPLASLTIVSGFLSLLAGLAGLAPLSRVLNLTAALVIESMDWLLQHGTALPGAWYPAQFRADWLTPAALAFMTALILAGTSVRWAKPYGGYWPPALALALIVILGVKFG